MVTKIGPAKLDALSRANQAYMTKLHYTSMYDEPMRDFVTHSDLSKYTWEATPTMANIKFDPFKNAPFFLQELDWLPERGAAEKLCITRQKFGQDEDLASKFKKGQEKFAKYVNNVAYK